MGFNSAFKGLKIQIVLYREHIVLLSERNVLETIPVDCTNYTEYTNTLVDKTHFLVVNSGAHLLIT